MFAQQAFTAVVQTVGSYMIKQSSVQQDPIKSITHLYTQAVLKQKKKRKVILVKTIQSLRHLHAMKTSFSHSLQYFVHKSLKLHITVNIPMMKKNTSKVRSLEKLLIKLNSGYTGSGICDIIWAHVATRLHNKWNTRLLSVPQLVLIHIFQLQYMCKCSAKHNKVT